LPIANWSLAENGFAIGNWQSAIANSLNPLSQHDWLLK
jgi:hypothetical protein